MSDHHHGARPAGPVPELHTITGHHQPAPFYLTADMFGGLPVEVVAAELSELVGRPVADRHTHEIDEVYLLLSPTQGAAVIEIDAGGAVHRLRSPGAFLVPTGTEHRFVTVQAERGSLCLGVLIGRETAGTRTLVRGWATDRMPGDQSGVNISSAIHTTVQPGQGT